MQVLCISDILWEIEDKDVLNRLKNEIKEVSPSLVLFAGDVINDGWNSEEHTDEFIELLHYLEELETTSFTIKGNHDEYSNYSAVERKIADLDYAEEISQTVAEFDGLKILGISYSYTHNLGKARQISEEFAGSYDIVVAHAESRRRIWLFELDAPVIVTGHFARSLCQVQNRAFVSMSAYPDETVIIEPESNELTYRQYPDSFAASQEMCETKARLENGELTWISDDYEPDVFGLRQLKDDNYPKQAERLISAKEKVAKCSEGEREIIEGLLEAGIPKTHIREYIGRYSYL